MSNLVDLNERAQDSFNKLRTKMKLDLQAPLIKKGIEINEKKIQQLLDNNVPITEYDAAHTLKDNAAMDEAIKEVRFVDDSFSFIESLNLPSQLSLVIGLIISSNKTKNMEDLQKATIALGNYLAFGDEE